MLNVLVLILTLIVYKYNEVMNELINKLSNKHTVYYIINCMYKQTTNSQYNMHKTTKYNYNFTYDGM